MYRVLCGKLREKRLTYKDVAKIINKSENAVKNKINGKTEFGMKEARAIRDAVAPEMSLDDLFAIEHTA